ncbi:hypothetical protein FRC0505_01983 [Corynebacterium diphtheriae]|nr:hypothetical protein [Corynebacterium diphtheriae]CAB0521119.1 hypothetical protein CIP107505_01854 [Corynebacterium diphtheriae]CAB0521822.1 hypothetical protein CIP107502_01901 [Corynebacterium diphtheriae]CAB0567830.1 hypothetical protein CIP107510_01977 [Corynebacterium diphtheriae]CAB0568328.1 hypothetical protein CIP107527_02078 [Corynebacterium diphtheriae]CAB0777479.1 hypothetical protein FRC0151_01943 [Corynebacterium diphtheriae]
MSSYIENAFDIIATLFDEIYDIFDYFGVFEIAKGLKALAGMWK